MSAAVVPAQGAAPAAWTDLAGLDSITTLGRADRGAALEAAARQFESFFVSQLLKGMRSANELFAADNPLNSNEMQFRQDMLDRQLSVSLTQGRGLGPRSALRGGVSREHQHGGERHRGGRARAAPGGAVGQAVAAAGVHRARGVGSRAA